MSGEQLPVDLEHAIWYCAHASLSGFTPDDDARKASDAIRAEHHQRLTLQRVADLEAERDTLRAKYDELLVALHGIGKALGIPEGERSPYSVMCGVLERVNRLAEIEAQEPVDVQVRVNSPRCTWQRPDATHDEPTPLARAQYLCANWPNQYSMRLLYARPAPAQAVPDFDLTLDCEASQYLHDMTEPAGDGEPATAVRLLFCAGHSGRGLYACSAEYPGEGAVLIAAAPERKA